MRWLPLIILIYLLLGIQVGAGPYLAIRGTQPNLGLIAVVFVSLNARRQVALTAAMAIGLAQDILSVHPLGLFAVAYALAAYLILGMREVVHREHPLTHFTFTIFAGVFVAGLILIEGWLRGPIPAAWQLLAGMGYSAIVAMILLAALQRARRIFFPPRGI